MMRRSVLTVIGISLLATGGALLSGCGTKEEEAPPPSMPAAATGPGASNPAMSSREGQAQAEAGAARARAMQGQQGQSPAPPGPR